MSRPEKYTVDYFQHDCIPKKTLFIIEERYGNDGYAFWYKLLENLGASNRHFLNLNDSTDLKYLASKMKVSESVCSEILDLLSSLHAIDGQLWKKKIVWCQKFVDRLSHIYEKRITEIPQKPDSKEIKNISGQLNGKIKHNIKISGVSNSVSGDTK